MVNTARANLTTPIRKPVRARASMLHLSDPSDAIGQTSDIPPPGVTAYSTRVNNDVTEEGVLLGAGVLPFTISPDGTLFFLLGREQYVQGWRGSETWSAFEGGTKSYDANVHETAAREYMEESLGVLHKSCSMKAISDVRREIEDGGYVLRVTLCIKNPELSASSKTHMRFHSTFVRLFEWDSGIVERFNVSRTALKKLSSDLKNAIKGNEPQMVPEMFRGHAAVVEKRLPGNAHILDVASDFLEKSEVQLWSANQLKEVVLNTHKGGEIFRPCFIRTMGVILQEFKRRLQRIPGALSYPQSSSELENDTTQPESAESNAPLNFEYE